jgi:hypothetical protein
MHERHDGSITATSRANAAFQQGNNLSDFVDLAVRRSAEALESRAGFSQIPRGLLQ